MSELRQKGCGHWQADRMQRESATAQLEGTGSSGETETRVGISGSGAVGR